MFAEKRSINTYVSHLVILTEGSAERENTMGEVSVVSFFWFVCKSRIGEDVAFLFCQTYMIYDEVAKMTDVCIMRGFAVWFGTTAV